MDSIFKPTALDFGVYVDDDSDLYDDNDAPLNSSIERHKNDVGIQTSPDYTSTALYKRKSEKHEEIETIFLNHDIGPSSIKATEDYLDFVLKRKVPVISPNLGALKERGYQKEVRDFNQFTSSLGIWALVDQKWTQELANWIGEKECLEVMAGNGLLAKALECKGVSTLATDDKSWDDPENEPFVFCDIKKLDAIEAIKVYGDCDVLIMSWPPPNVSISFDVLKVWGSDKPIVFIGDKAGGMTACDEFYKYFKPIVQQPVKSYMPSHGAEDNVIIGYYKPQP